MFLFLVMQPFMRYVLVDIFNLSHISVANATAAVVHKHIAVNKPDTIVCEHMPMVLHKAVGHSLIYIVILPVV